MGEAESNPNFAASYVECAGCPRFWGAPAGISIAGRCQLRREWLWQTRRCSRYEIEMEERRQRYRREAAGAAQRPEKGA